MKRNGTPGETEEEGVHRGVGKRRGRNPPPHLKSRCRGRGKRGENQPPSQNVTFGRCTGNSRLDSQEEEGPREQGRIFFFALLHSNWHCRNTTRTHKEHPLLLTRCFVLKRYARFGRTVSFGPCTLEAWRESNDEQKEQRREERHSDSLHAPWACRSTTGAVVVGSIVSVAAAVVDDMVLRLLRVLPLCILAADEWWWRWWWW